MTAVAVQLGIGASRSRVPDRRWMLLYALLPALHLLMFGYDLLHPDRFLNADRAGDRLLELEGFRQAWQGGDVAGFVAGHGIVGDWLPQALLYLWGGQYFVIAVQALLALLSVIWVRGIGTRLGLEPHAASLAALMYGLLPHTLVFPHQLASEAIFDPLVVGSFALLVRAAVLGRGLAPAGVLLGAATLVRPITLLWPLVCIPFLAAPARARAAFVLAALAPLCLWVAFIFAATGEPSMGRSDHDLGSNLYDRAVRIATAAGVPAPQSPTGDHRLSVPGYLRFALEHPGPALLHSARDVTVLGVKSGFERVMLDYLDLAPRQRVEVQGTEGWRSQLERRGAWAALKTMSERDPGFVLVAASGAALFAGLMLLAFAGALAWLRERGPGAAPSPVRELRVMLMLFPLYIVATAQVVDAAQSRHRAPAEFALCLLAVAGVPVLRRLFGGVRHGR